MRKRPKLDNNHRQIKNELEQCYIKIVDLAGVGDDVPDLLVARRGINLLVELKSPGGKLSPGQYEFILQWPAPVMVADCIEQIIEAFDQLEAGYFNFTQWPLRWELLEKYSPFKEG